jgi:hypothetical protein
MRYLRLLIASISAICILALGVFALVRAPRPIQGGDVIIIKGGSLTIQCPEAANANSMPFESGTQKYNHKKDTG